MSNLVAPVLDSIVSGYERLLAAGDPRVEDLLLMQTPVPITLICLSYIYFVLSLGPRLMADRKPFGLRPVLLLYNAGQTVFSAVLFFVGLRHWIKCFGWGLTCMPVNFELRTPDEMLTIRLCHIYFLSKITELADTVFFVMKKKHNHITLLHVFHHAAMPFSVWVGVKFNPGGNMAFFGLPNLFVHMWMYLYYFVAALGPNYQKYIWWKRYITQMQLAQFFLVMVYMLFVATKCTLNKTLLFWIFFLDITFVILFADFYWKTYLKKKTVKGEGGGGSGGGSGEVSAAEAAGREEPLAASASASTEASDHGGKANGFSCQKGNSSKKKDL